MPEQKNPQPPPRPHAPEHSDQQQQPDLAGEADIGSGEKTPAQRETEELIRQVPASPPLKP